jgi:hypothetical protein
LRPAQLRLVHFLGELMGAFLTATINGVSGADGVVKSTMLKLGPKHELDNAVRDELALETVALETDETELDAVLVKQEPDAVTSLPLEPSLKTPLLQYDMRTRMAATACAQPFSQA